MDCPAVDSIHDAQLHIVGWMSIENFLSTYYSVLELVLLTLRIVQILQPFQKLQTASNVFAVWQVLIWYVH